MNLLEKDLLQIVFEALILLGGASDCFLFYFLIDFAFWLPLYFLQDWIIFLFRDAKVGMEEKTLSNWVMKLMYGVCFFGMEALLKQREA